MRNLGLFFISLCTVSSVWAQGESVLACETCGCSPVTSPIQNFYEPGWVIQVHGQYSSLTTGLEGTQTLENRERQRVTSAITQLSAAYNFSQEFGLSLTVPYIDRSYRRTNGTQMESGTVAGLGDVTLAARYTPVARFDEESSFVWNLQAGLKMPTGSASQLKQEVSHAQAEQALANSSQAEVSPRRLDPDIRLHGTEEHEEEEDHQQATQAPALPESLVGGHDLALGSGSLDGVLGTTLFLRQQSFFLNAGAQYLLRTRGAYGYQFGNAFLWNLSPGVFLARDEDQLLGVQLNLSGEIKAQDNVSGFRIDHTGMNALYAGPQVFASGQDLNILAGVDFPLYQHTDGPTLVPDYRLRLQMNWKL